MPIAVEAELKRRPAGGGALVDWELVTDADNPDTSRADPVKDFGVRSRLDTANTHLTSILDSVDTVETILQAIEDNTDGLEGFVDNIEALLTTIRDNADTLETSIANLALEATVQHLKNKFARGLRITKAGTANTLGDNDVLVPAAGNKIVVHWLGLFTSQNNSAENEVTAKFAAAGDAKYIVPMGNPGAFSHWEPIEGTADQKFILNLSSTQPVKWNVTYEEVS